MNSNFLSLGKKDFLKGLIVAIIGSLVGFAMSVVNTAITTGVFDITGKDLKMALFLAVGAGLSYISKNFFTNSDGKIAKAEPPKQL